MQFVPVINLYFTFTSNLKAMFTWKLYHFEPASGGRSGGLFQNFPQFIVIHTVKGFDIVTEESGGLQSMGSKELDTT